MRNENQAPPVTQLIDLAAERLICAALFASILLVTVSCNSKKVSNAEGPLTSKRDSNAEGPLTVVDARSMSFSTPEEKMRFLRRYLKNHSGLQDAEYIITYSDNSGGLVPGPSDYDMRFALRIAPDSLVAWTTGLNKQGGAMSTALWSHLALDPVRWSTSSRPELYTGPGQVKLVYRTEGIVYAYYSTMMVDLKPYLIEEQ